MRRACAGKKLALLELDVGFNTPSIIRFPFEGLVYHNPKAVLIRVNRDHAQGAKTITLTEDMAELARELLQRQLSRAFAHKHLT